jgi:hypothetical protein
VQRVWKSFYTIIFCAGPIQGYYSGLTERAKTTNAGWIFVAIIFVIMLAFPVMAMAYSRLRGVATYMRPSFNRWPFGWWSDTLQPIRVTVVWSMLYALGAVLALLRVDHQEALFVWFYVAWALGLWLGERLIYWVYADRISEPTCSSN